MPPTAAAQLQRHGGIWPINWSRCSAWRRCDGCLAGSAPPRGRAQPWRIRPRRDGWIAAALIMGLSLAHALTLQPAGSARPEASVHVSNEVARAASAGQKRTLTRITAGMRRPTQTADRDVQLAAFNPAAIAIAPPRDRRTPLEDVVIDAIVAYTKAAARDYRDIVGEVSSPPSKETTSPSA
jgi:hypothetical protein